MATVAVPVPIKTGDSGNTWLDETLKVERCSHGTSLIPSEAMQSSPGYLHFSIPVTVAEEAAWRALGEEHAVPAQLSVNLLRPATLEGGNISGIGRAIRKGRQVLIAEGEAWQGTKHICTVLVVFVPFEKLPQSVRQAVMDKGNVRLLH